MPKDRLVEIKNKLLDLAQELRNEYLKDFINYKPLCPWVLVYTLPRDMRLASGLWVPNDEKQNKTTFEGIVLETWEPYTYEGVQHKSTLNVGDCVLFPHYTGQPVTRESDKYFRLVKEFSDKNNEVRGDDCIFAKLNYSKRDIHLEVAKALADGSSVESNYYENLATTLMKDWIIYPKRSQTLSGK